jgi:hypothetical protein
MSKLLISLAVSVALLLLLVQYVDAGVKGTLKAAGGHECKWREKSRGKDKRDLRLDCECEDKEGNNVEYTCYYVSYYEQCCQNEAKSNAHYHDHAVAYYSQAADKIKGMSWLLLIL